MFLLLMPVMVPFIRAHGLTMTEVFELQTVYALGLVTLEVPSGYVADLIGRKRCLVLASICYGVAFTWLATAATFWDFVGFELVAAVAASSASRSSRRASARRLPASRRARSSLSSCSIAVIASPYFSLAVA